MTVPLFSCNILIMQSKKTTVALFFGGVSPEHEVSVITGIQAIENIDREKFDVLPVYIAKDGRWYTGPELTKIETYRNLLRIPEKATQETVSMDNKEKCLRPLTKKSMFPFRKAPNRQPIDVIFPCFHGGLGENGGLAGVFEAIDIPYVGPGITGGVLGMDKVVMKQLFHDKGIPITKYQWFFRNSWEKERDLILRKLEKVLKYPMFVKPANGGSSIGTGKVKNKKELENAIEIAVVFDRKILIEESFENSREINISVIGNAGTDDLMISVCEEVFSSGEILTYEDKYMGNSKTGASKGIARTKREIPAKIPKEIERKIRKTAIDVFNVLDASGVARIDFLYQERTGEIVVLEINTIPGSLSFYLWKATGLSFKNMLTKLIKLAIERHEDSKKNTTTFQSNILKNFNTVRSKQ